MYVFRWGWAVVVDKAALCICGFLKAVEMWEVEACKVGSYCSCVGSVHTYEVNCLRFCCVVKTAREKFVN